MANKQVDVNQAQDIVRNFVAYTMQKSPEDITILLKKNGVVVPAKSSPKDTMTLLYAALPKSRNLQHDLQDYFMRVHAVESKSGGDFSNYVEEGFFSADSATTGTATKTLTAKQQSRVSETNPQGKTAFGLALQNLVSPDSLKNVLNAGISMVSSKLSATADSKSLATATEYEVAQTEKLQKQQELEATKAQSKKWVMPVVIGSVVLVIGITAYFLLKKKK